jgi:hypothetical protein
MSLHHLNPNPALGKKHGRRRPTEPGPDYQHICHEKHLIN